LPIDVGPIRPPIPVTGATCTQPRGRLAIPARAAAAESACWSRPRRGAFHLGSGRPGERGRAALPIVGAPRRDRLREEHSEGLLRGRGFPGGGDNLVTSTSSILNIYPGCGSRPGTWRSDVPARRRVKKEDLFSAATEDPTDRLSSVEFANGYRTTFRDRGVLPAPRHLLLRGRIQSVGALPWT